MRRRESLRRRRLVRSVAYRIVLSREWNYQARWRDGRVQCLGWLFILDPWSLFDQIAQDRLQSSKNRRDIDGFRDVPVKTFGQGQFSVADLRMCCNGNAPYMRGLGIIS